MEYLVKIIRILEIIGFVVANLAIFILFSHYIAGASDILYIVAFLGSMVILKNQWFISSTTIPRAGTRFQSIISFFQSVAVFVKNLFIKKIPAVKFFVVGSKQLFYNVLFELFPVLIIWLCVFGVSYFTGLGRSFTVNNETTFFAIVTVFGIVLGIFQYYLQRHEEKISAQISIYSNQIVNIVNEETDFNNFYKKLEEYQPNGLEIRKWVERQIDPKYKLVDLLKAIDENNELRRLFLDLAREGNYGSLITINMDSSTSDQHYKMIELYARGDIMHEKLFSAYERYFDSEERIDEIYLKMCEKIEIDGFTKLVLSNINIIQEILPMFVNTKFKKFFEQSMIEQDFSRITPQSADEFRGLLVFKLYSRIMKSVLS